MVIQRKAETPQLEQGRGTSAVSPYEAPVLLNVTLTWVEEERERVMSRGIAAEVGKAVRGGKRGKSWEKSHFLHTKLKNKKMV